MDMTHRNGLLAVGTLAVIAGGGTIPTALAHTSESGSATLRSATIRLTNHQDTFQYDDTGPTGPSAGDQYFITSHVVHGQSGHTVASCSIDTAANGGSRQCEIDFMLKRGLVTTRGLTNLASKTVHLVITGGARHYAHASGVGTLTPTATGSKVVLTLDKSR
jgi:hypothetical protein